MGKGFLKILLLRILFITLGCAIAAFALEKFLIPNSVIDGGIVGISIMVSYVTKYPLGMFLVILNLPFIILALQHFGKMFVFLMFYAVIMLGLFTSIFNIAHTSITNDTLLAAVFGGMLLGLGVGLVLKSNASLDGTEILAIKLSQKYPFSVGEIIMFFNVFIFICAGFLYGPDKGMYSTITYFIAYRVMDIVLQGLNEAKSIFIITSKYDEIGTAIMKNFNKSVTYLNAEGGYSGKKTMMIYCVIAKLELTKIKELVNNIDDGAFIAIENVHEVDGKRYRKQRH